MSENEPEHGINDELMRVLNEAGEHVMSIEWAEAEIQLLYDQFSALMNATNSPFTEAERKLHEGLGSLLRELRQLETDIKADDNE